MSAPDSGKPLDAVSRTTTNSATGQHDFIAIPPRPGRDTVRFMFWQSGNACGRCGIKWRQHLDSVGLLVMTYLPLLGVWVCDRCLRPGEETQ